MNIRFHLISSWKDSPKTKDERWYWSLSNYSVNYPQTSPYVEFGPTQMVEAKSFELSSYEVVELISIMERLPVYPERARGEYVFGKARGVVDMVQSNKTSLYQILITSSCLETNSEFHPASFSDALELLDMIRCGKIRPVKSWEETQIGRSEKRPRKHLRERTRPRFRLGARQSSVY